MFFLADARFVDGGGARRGPDFFTSGPLYLQRVPSGRISGLTFRYVGSDQHSAINVLDSSCTVTQCRATEGILSGVVIYGPECRAAFIDNEVSATGNRASLCLQVRSLVSRTTSAGAIIILGSPYGIAEAVPSLYGIDALIIG